MINNRTIDKSTSQHFKITCKKIVEIVKTTTISVEILIEIVFNVE